MAQKAKDNASSAHLRLLQALAQHLISAMSTVESDLDLHSQLVRICFYFYQCDPVPMYNKVPADKLSD